MSIEVTILYVATLLGLAQVLLASQLVTMQRGIKWNLSSRDQSAPPLHGAAGRLDRAAKNFLETFPFFAAAILMLQILGRNSNLSELGAEIYLIARVVYVPVYGIGITGLRSAIWLASLVGLAMVLLAIIY